MVPVASILSLRTPAMKVCVFQHTLASVCTCLQAAELMTDKAAALYDQGRPCGLETNAACHLAGSCAYEAAVWTYGGFGFAQEYHIECYFRESVLNFTAPVSEELILSYVAAKALGMTKSY